MVCSISGGTFGFHFYFILGDIGMEYLVITMEYCVIF